MEISALDLFEELRFNRYIERFKLREGAFGAGSVLHDNAENTDETIIPDKTRVRVGLPLTLLEISKTIATAIIPNRKLTKVICR